MNDELVAKCSRLFPDRRQLVVLASKRARQLARGARPLLKTDVQSHLDIALHEISEGLLETEKGKDKEGKESK